MADGSIIVQRRTRTLTVADLFCGAGGMSTGADRALRELGLRMNLVGVNHWPVAIETNRRNHPEHAARIACANLETALPLDHVPEGRLDLLMAAPSCVFHSRARGGRPVHDQQRMDPWHVVRWCTELRVARLLVENVPEFVDWGPCSLVTGRPIKSRRGEYFRAWVAALQAVGFRLDWRVLCCADYGDPTTRRRFFLIGRSDRGPLRWPDPTHARAGAEDLLGSRARWRGAREVIDWSMAGASIFSRKRPLKPNTLRRILAGAVKYSWPQPYVDALQALLDGAEPRLTFGQAEAVTSGLVAPSAAELGIVMATGAGGAPRALDEPLPTITTGGAGGARPHFIEPLVVSKHGGPWNEARGVSEPMFTVSTAGAGALAEPLIVPVSNSSSAGTPRSAAEPIRTVTTAKGGDQALAMPLLQSYYGASAVASSVTEPVPSVTTKARFGLAEPVLVRAGHGDSDGRDPGSRVLDPDAPMPALTGSNEVALAQPFLVPNFGERDGQAPRVHAIDEPVPTITASGHVQIAAPAIDPVSAEVRIDVNYRMLHWRELARATSFDDEGHVYDFAGTATEITKQIGNAVPNRTAKALVRSLMRDAA